MGNWTNLNSWFHSLEESGSGILNDKVLSERFLKSGLSSASQQKAFEDALKIGLGVHSTQKELQNLTSVMKKVGYDQVRISGDEKNGYKISFLPSNPQARTAIKNENIPSVEIMPSGNMGITITNNLPAIDALHFVQNQGGEIGLARSVALGISTAARELEDRVAWLEKQNLDYDKKAKLVARTIKQAVRSVSHENPAATTKNQKEDYSKSVSLKNVGQLRREGVGAMSMQAHTSFVYKTMLNKLSGMLGKNGAPRDELAAFREFDDIAQASGGFSNIKDLENYVKKVHPWFYKNVWAGNLKNLYTTVYGIGSSQGIKKEGVSGLISLSQPILPGTQLAGISDRKMGQNLRAYSKKISNEAVQALRNFEKGGALDKNAAGKYFRFTTKQQRALYSQSELENAAHTHRAYLSADISSEHIARAAESLIKEQIKAKLGRDIAGSVSRKDIKDLEGVLNSKEQQELQHIMHDALKGVDADASVYAQQYLDDFRFAVVERKRVSREVIEDLVNEMAEKAVSKTDQYKNADEAGRKNLIQLKKNLLGPQLQRQAIKRALGLNRTDKIVGVEDDQEFLGDLAVTVKQKLNNGSFTTRGLTMTDFRSATSNMNNKLFGRALELAGYRKQDIYTNGKDASGGLNIAFARGEHKMKPRDTVNGLLQLIAGNLEKQGKSKNDIIAAFGGLGGLVGNAGAAGYDFDNVALEQILASGGATGLILQLGELAVTSGAVSGPGIKDNLFELPTKGSEIRWKGRKVPLPIAAGRFSGDIYQRTGHGASKMRYTEGALRSLDSTLELIRKDNPSANLSALENKRNQIAGKLAELEDTWKKRYGTSAEHIGASFQGNAAKSEAALKRAGGIAIDIAELAPMGIAEDIQYDTESGRGGILINGDDGIAILEKIKDRQKEQAKALGMDEKLAGDIPVAIYAKDANGDLIPFFTSDSKGNVHVGYHARLGSADIGERYKIGDSFYIPLDTIGKSNFDIIRTMFELSTADTDQAKMRDAQRKAGGKIASISGEMLEQMGSGSVYEKYHSFYEESGGYLLAQAMNPETRKSLYSMYGWDEGNAPSVVVGRKAMKDILSSASEDILQQQYKEFFGTDPDKALDKTKLINTLVNALNIDSENYKGKINRSSALFRFPLLKMYDDFISGGLVVSDAIAKGNMLVDPDFARTIHADFDGDRYPIFNLLLQGDYAGAEKALRQYYADKEQAQVQARIKDTKKKSSKYFAGIKDMEAPLDTAAEKMKMQAQNVGGKWAGISGDLLLRGVDKLAKSTNLEAEERQLIALLGQMYQVGINIKNLKPEQLKGTNAAELQNRLYSLVRKPGTWDSKEGLTNIFTIMGRLGIFSDAMNPKGQLNFTKGIFNNEVLANMGIDDPKSLGVFGMKYPNVKNLIGAFMSLKGKLLSSGQQTVGQMMNNLYSGGFINTYESGVLNTANQKDLDEAAAKLVGIVGPEAESDSVFVSASQAVAKVLGKKSARHTTATAVKKIPFGGLEEHGPGASFKGLEELLKKVDINKPKSVAAFLTKYGEHIPLMLSTLAGNVTHNFAEGFLTGNRSGLSKKSAQYKDYVDAYAKLYQLGQISLNPAVAAASGLQQLEDGTYDPQKVAEYMVGVHGKRGVALGRKVKEEGNTLQEMPIFGAAYGGVFHGSSDAISINQGKEGTVITVTDYKARSGKGGFEPEYGVQLLSYIHNLKAYNEAIQAFKNEGVQNTTDLFSNIATETLDPKDKSNRAGMVRIVQGWLEQAKGKEGGLEKLTALTDALFNANGKVEFRGQALVTGSDGQAHFYGADLNNEIVQKILNSFKEDTPLHLSEEERNLFQSQGFRELYDKGGALTEEDRLKQANIDEYLKAKGELIATQQKYINVSAELETELGRKYGDPEKIRELQERKDQLEKELNGELKWTVDKEGKPVSYRVPGKVQGVADLRKGLEDVEGLDDVVKLLFGEPQEADRAYFERVARLKDFKEQKSAQQQAFSTYKSVYEYDSRIEKANRLLEQENNEDKREILRQEIEDLKDLRAIAQETLELLEEAHKGDPKWTDEKSGFFALAKKRAQLTHRKEQSMQPSTADGGLFGDISGQFSNYFSRFVVGRAAMNIMSKLRQGLKMLVQNAKALDSTLTNLRIVTNGTKEDTRRLMTEYSNLGQKIGATTQEVSASALEWQRQGYQTAQIQDLVTSSLYLSKLGMIDATAATKDLTSALKGFKMQASESMDIVDKLTAIDLKAATSAGDIAEGLAQFANIGSLAGVDMDQAAAYVATIADVTQASGTQVGTSMKTIISRYGNVKAGAYNKMNLASAEEGDAVNDVEKVLNKIGISIRSSSLTFKDFDEVLAEVAEKWDALDNVSKKAIATALAGIRQQESVVTLLSNWTKYEELLEVSRNSRGTAETKYTAYQESYQAAQKRLTAAVENIASNSGVAGLLTEGTNLLASLVNALPDIIKWLPSLVAGMSNIRALSGRSWLQRGVRGLQDKGRLRSFSSFFVGDKRRDAADAYVAAGGFRFFKSKKDFKGASDDAGAAAVASAEQIQNAMGKAAQQGQRIVIQGKAVAADAAKEKQLKDDVVAAGAQEKSEKQETASSSKGGAWASAGMLGVTMAINQTMAGLSAALTGGQTHTDSRGNTVTSSERATRASKTIAGLLTTMIPFIGSHLGDVFGNLVARSIDKVRDDVHNLSADAQERTNVLQHISSQISKIKDLSTLMGIDDMREANNLADEFLSEIYKSENDATREVFKEELGKINNGNDDLYALVQAFKNETAHDRKEAARKLEIAQTKALHRQQRLARNEDIYNQEDKLGQAQLQYNSAFGGYTSAGITNVEMLNAVSTGVGAGLGMQSITALGLGMLAVGGPILKILGGILTAGGLIGGIFTGQRAGSAEAEKYKEQRARAWENTLISDKLTILSEQADNLKKQVEYGNDIEREGAQKQLAATEKMVAAFKDYQQYVWTLRDEDNKMLVEEALLTAQAEGSGRMQYLTDLNIVELKRLGVGNIYRALAEEVEKSGGIAGYSMRYENGELSAGFLKYAERVLKTDEEIAAVISGESYKLVEALDKLNPNDQFDRPILESFATAVGTSVENLPQFITKVGELTLGDLLKSTQELIDATSGFSSMLNTMASSTESISGWMNKIVAQYPDLIAYMSDTPRVMEAMMEKLRQFNNQELKEQWEQYAASEEYYEKVFAPNIRAYIADLRENGETNFSDTAVRNALTSSKAQNMAELLKFLLGQDTSEGSLYGLILKAFQHASGDTLVADLYREQLKNATEFIANAYQKQVDALTEQRNMLENINKQREYELKLLKARVRLEEAMNDKRRIYRAGVGWVYEADQNKIAEAQKEVEDLSIEKQISRIDKQISAIAYIAEKWKTLWDVRNEEQKQELTEIFFGEFTQGGKGAVQAIVDGFSESFNMPVDGGESVSSLLSESVRLLRGIKEPVDKMSEQIVTAKIQDKNKKIDALKEAYDDYLSFIKKGGYTATDYNAVLEKLQRAYTVAEQAGYISEDSFSDSGKGLYSTAAKNVIQSSLLTPKYKYTMNNYGRKNNLAQGFTVTTDFQENVTRKQAASILEMNGGGEVLFVADESKPGGYATYYNFTDWLDQNYDEDVSQYDAKSIEELGAVLKDKNAQEVVIVKDGSAYIYKDGGFYKASLAVGDLFGKSGWTWGSELTATSDQAQGAITAEQKQALSRLSSAIQNYWGVKKDGLSKETAILYTDYKNAQTAAGKSVGDYAFFINALANMVETGISPYTSRLGYSQLYIWATGAHGNGNVTSGGTNGSIGQGQANSVAAAGGMHNLAAASSVLLNELGTEAIVTPSGTITALPAHSGILPADITTNLWALGEIAPNLLRAVEGGISLRNGVSGSAPLCDESFNINNLTMNVSADSSFDADAFVKSIKARVALTKNLT